MLEPSESWQLFSAIYVCYWYYQEHGKDIVDDFGSCFCLILHDYHEIWLRETNFLFWSDQMSRDLEGNPPDRPQACCSFTLPH